MLFRMLVEGPDDLHLVKNLAREHGIELVEKQTIRECGGVAPLLEEILARAPAGQL